MAMNWDWAETTAIFAAIISLGSMAFAALSWRTANDQARIAKVQAQAALFQERFQVYSATKEFLRPWFAHGVPDLNELGKLIEAWEKSQFLFDQPVTDFLRQLWLDAITAEMDHKVVEGKIEGDLAKAIERSTRLKHQYLFGNEDEPPVIVEAFKSMKIDY